MDRQGTISEGQVRTLVTHASEEGLSGILAFKNSHKEISLLLEAGKLSLHRVNGQKAVRIGEILVDRGHISSRDLLQALEAQKTSRRRLGEILVEMDLVSEEEVERAVDMQVEEEIFELFAWEEGEYTFQPEARGEDSLSETILDIGALVERSIVSLEEWKQITREIRDDREIFILEREGRDAFLASLTDGMDREVLTLLTGEKDVGDIVDELLLPRFKVYRILGRYLKSGKIRRPTLEELKSASAYLKQEGRPHMALKMLERAFDLYPEDDEVVGNLADLFESMGEKRRAAAYVKIVADRRAQAGEEEEALRLFKRIADLQPADNNVLEMLYEKAEARGRGEEAAEYARSLTKIYHSTRSFDRAADFGRKVLEVFPEDLSARQKLINVYLESGRIEEAIPQFETLVSLLKGNAQLDPLQRDRELCRVYEKILRLDASRKDIRKKLEALRPGVAAKEGKKIPKRLVTLPRALAVILALGGLVVGAVYLYRWRAGEKFREAEARATALADQGKLVEAAEAYGKISIAYPWTSFAEIAIRRRRALQAEIEEIQQAQKEREDQARQQIALGMDLLGRGDVEGARALFLGVLDEAPSGDITGEAKLALKRIEEHEARKVQERAEDLEARFERMLQDVKPFLEADDVGRLASAVRVLEKARQTLDHLAALGLRNLETEVRKNRETVSGLRRDVETRMQKIFAERGFESWGRTVEDLEIARGHLRKARNLRGDPEIRARVEETLEEIDRYDRKARQLAVSIKETLNGVMSLPPTRRREAMNRALEETRALIRDYQKSAPAKKARFPLLVETRPAGARVVVADGAGETQQTPAVIRYAPGERVRVEVLKKGYKRETFHTDSRSAVVSMDLAKSFLWRRPLGSTFQGRVDARGFYVFAGDRGGDVHAVLVNPVTGEPEKAWPTYTVDDFSGIKAAVVLSRKTLFLCTASKGELHAVDMDSGLSRWKHPYRAGRMVDHEPVPAPRLGTVFLGDVEGRVHAVDMRTGESRWTRKIEARKPRVTAAPVLFEGDDPALFVPTRGGEIVCLDPLSGETLRRFEPFAEVLGDIPVPIHLSVAGGLLLVKRGRQLGAFPATGGQGEAAEPVWSVRASSYSFSDPFVAGDTVAVAEEGGVLDLFRLKDGRRMARSEPLPGIQQVLSPLKIGEDRFLLCSAERETGRLVALERRGSAFRTIWTYDAPTGILGAPRLSGDTIFFGGADGNLYGVGAE